MKRLLSEPLCQFLLLGALIFAADAWLGASNEKSERTIRVTQLQLDALKTAFRTEKGRLPSDAELQLRVQQWLDEQMLYRQARSLGLDKRDAIVRRQMVQKMRFLLADSQPVPEPGELELQAFLETHAQRYGHSPSLSFEQVYLSRGHQAENMGQAVRATLSQLQADPQSYRSLGDAFPTGQALSGMSEENMRREFGQGFYQRLLALPDQQWQGPIASSLGLHFVRITARSDFRPAQLSEVRDRVANDWRVQQREQMNDRAMQKLREQFHIEYEGLLSMGNG